ncbi:insulinase family protein [Candidatus Saganbacteria bacterium]|nr:insulinase family protein [Candidatus Saganbacteria bacterium]
MIPQAEITTLPNGSKVITENIPSLRSAALGVMVGAGSGDELPDEAGLTHFIEHMAFKGTDKRTAFQIAETIDAVGGKINAYTGKEYTVYYSVVLDKHLDVAADVISDIFLNPLLRTEDIEMEKGVVLEEINMYEDTPDELIHDLFAETILHNHPLGKPTLGSKASVGGFKRESFTKYRSRLYKPDNVIVAAAGNLEHKQVLDFCQSFFAGFSGAVSKPPLPEPIIKSEIKLKTKKTEQTHLCLGVRGPSQTSEDRYSFTVMDTILGGSMSSRLFQEVREKRGLAYSIFSTGMPFRDFGIFYAYSGCDKKNLGQVVELILEQFRLMRSEGITEKEMERGKEHLKGNLVLGMESSPSRMNWLAKSQFYYGRVMTVEEVFEKIDQVSQTDIIQLANNYLKNEYLTLTVIGDLDKLPLDRFVL